GGADDEGIIAEPHHPLRPHIADAVARGEVAPVERRLPMLEDREAPCILRRIDAAAAGDELRRAHEKNLPAEEIIRLPAGPVALPEAEDDVRLLHRIAGGEGAELHLDVGMGLDEA